MKTLSVIFPAFNEQANIVHTVEKAIGILPEVAEAWEIIVVNDGSQDETGRICDGLADRYPEVRVVHHTANRGYGAALKSGILEAQYNLIFFSDSDAQFDLNELPQFVVWAEDYDIVAGYRGKRRDPIHRIVNAWGWNILVRSLLGLRIRDIDCAFKVFRREVFERIQIRSVGAMVNTEILAQALRFGMRIKEVQVSHFPRRYGQQTGASLRVVVKAFHELFRLWSKLQKISKNQKGLYQEPVVISNRVGKKHAMRGRRTS